MSEHLILVEHAKDWKAHYPAVNVVLEKDYLSQPQFSQLKDAKVINLCRSYSYMSLGYYCSLLAEARHHKVIPSVRTITDLSSKAIYGLHFEDFDEMVQKRLQKAISNTAQDSKFALNIFFGQCVHKELQEVARQLFDAFRCPLLKVEFHFHERWQISSIKSVHIDDLEPEQEALFVEALTAYLSRRWRTPKKKSIARYDMAILHDPQDPMPPSKVRTLEKFVKAGKRLGVSIDLIQKKDYPKLGEYDALFIRETTRINHHTYRFAKKAESEGMVVIDDPDSIVRCTNKVYLAELMAANRVPTPKTIVLHKGNLQILEDGAAIPYPLVLKIPDGSFSRGVLKANNPHEARIIAAQLFKESDLILAQEFVYTEFDWRIGILNRQPMFACQYFMSKHHWQIVKYTSSGRFDEGRWKTWPIEDVSPAIVNTALKAANLIGDSLYGVDVKQTEKGAFVIEVNDNPNIDMGVEDACLREMLYDRIISEFVRRLDMYTGL